MDRYEVDPARLALVAEVVSMNAQFSALLDRINDAVDPDRKIMDPCLTARNLIADAAEKAMAVSMWRATTRVPLDPWGRSPKELAATMAGD